MTRNQSTLFLISLLALLTACSSTPMATDSQTPGQAIDAAVTAVKSAASNVMPGSGNATTSASNVATVSLPAYLDPKSRLSSERSVYFAYDEYVISADYAGLIERHGRYLAAHPELAIRIEGNSDERGGSEYNLALGQKRADAVLRALKIYGVRDMQLEAISWGEAKTQSAGGTEAGWAQDRRADLQYPRK